MENGIDMTSRAGEQPEESSPSYSIVIDCIRSPGKKIEWHSNASPVAQEQDQLKAAVTILISPRDCEWPSIDDTNEEMIDDLFVIAFCGVGVQVLGHILHFGWTMMIDCAALPQRAFSEPLYAVWVGGCFAWDRWEVMSWFREYSCTVIMSIHFHRNRAANGKPINQSLLQMGWVRLQVAEYN